MSSWRKAPPDLVERFNDVVGGIAGVEQRKMFGYPAAFIGGNMVTSLHQESWIVRLSEAERAERLRGGWTLFEPMAGRPMREYVTLPDAVTRDRAEARRWVEAAADYVSTLPAKPARGRRRSA